MKIENYNKAKKLMEIHGRFTNAIDALKTDLAKDRPESDGTTTAANSYYAFYLSEHGDGSYKIDLTGLGVQKEAKQFILKMLEKKVKAVVAEIEPL